MAPGHDLSTFLLLPHTFLHPKVSHLDLRVDSSKDETRWLGKIICSKQTMKIIDVFMWKKVNLGYK